MTSLPGDRAQATRPRHPFQGRGTGANPLGVQQWGQSQLVGHGGLGGMKFFMLVRPEVAEGAVAPNCLSVGTLSLRQAI
jgi:hypothetical protein